MRKDQAALEEYQRLGLLMKDGDLDHFEYYSMEKPPELGVPNASADAVQRNDVTWCDGFIDRDFSETGRDWAERPLPPQTFDRLLCRNCGGLTFEVLKTAEYETCARCVGCGFYYVAHEG